MARIEVGALHHLPKRIGKCVKIGHMELALFRLSNDHVYAVENRCPHRGGDLSQGIVSGEFLFCPLHDWKICMRDGNVQAPDRGCVKTYKVEIENEKIYVQL
ncbi:assimilatory nitrite reductase (NAD(P)H) small subunit [Anoxybacillus vitaminiphilus]|uniref:Assimilatory nitrite reductase (NAD(P)H) small subunit n=1 Tax=Paranoxybacillus vitaminiphilus TaxID=581036 RepID=A0A327YIR1_9BACL|nr:nitrite reductase small subunit NirD [Anoxybacillus vitaminiphilus]RAK18249.1 assimilatory nitrite reductase (NAD(P)H) small subunit [Anoxybacillus vitaminiphilus]